MNAPCHILVPASFSVRSDAALDYATLLARRLGANIDLLHVRSTPTSRGRPRGPSLFADSDEGLAMERALSRGQAHRVDIRARVEFGDLCETIARIAETGGYDLVIIGQHAHTVSSPRSSEDVACRVSRRVRCPVLVLDAEMVPETRDVLATGPLDASGSPRHP